jgi:dTDP-glucose 4,6-dehydratase
LGVCTLIEIVKNLNIELIHISTDEVYGVPGPGECFDESSSLNPKNPYAATKASADHLIFSAINTFGIRAKIIRPSNNFGPRQHSEKFIPTILQSLASGNKVPVYGDGLQKREWTFVKDTAQAIADFCQNSDFGNGVFNLSSENQLTNIEIIKILCNILDRDVENTVDYVKDRPGHDREYKIKNSILKEKTDLVRALQETVIEFKKNMEKK